MAAINFNALASPYSTALVGTEGWTCSRTTTLEITGNTSGLSGPGTHSNTGLLFWRPPASPSQVFSSSAPLSTYTAVAGAQSLFVNRPAGDPTTLFTVYANFTGGGGVFLQNEGSNFGTMNVAGTVAGLTGTNVDGLFGNMMRIYFAGTLSLIDMPAQLTYSHAGVAGNVASTFLIENATANAVYPTVVTMGFESDSFATRNPCILRSSGTQAFSFGSATNGSIRRTAGVGLATTMLFQLGGSNTGLNTMLYGTVVTGGRKIELQKIDAGRWLLEGDNSALTSPLTISGGTLRAKTHSNAIGANASSVIVSTGTTLELEHETGQTWQQPLTLSGTVSSVGGNNMLTGTIALAGASILSSDVAAKTLTLNSGVNNLTGSNTALAAACAGSIDIYQAIATGTGSLTKSGAATLTLRSSTSSYTGATVLNGGKVTAHALASNGTASSIGQGTALTFSSATTLEYVGSTSVVLDRTTSYVTGAAYENNGGTLRVTGIASGSPTSISLSGTHGATGAAGFTTFASPIGNIACGFAKSGTGRWIVSGGDNLTGTSTVTAGTLMAANAAGGSKKLLGSNVTVSGGARVQIGSDSDQQGKNRYFKLSMGGANSGNRARLRIGGSAVSPTIQMSGNLVLPTGSDKANFDLSADLFKTPGTYTLIEFTGSGTVTGGGTVESNITATGLASGRSAAFTYNSGASPKTVTVAIS